MLPFSRRICQLYKLLVIPIVLVVTCGFQASAAYASGPVTIDGRLGDLIEREAMGEALLIEDDPADIFAVCKSGFDFTNIYVYYDVACNRLIVGLDLLDGDTPGDPNMPSDINVPTILGLGVPGDADGDNDPSVSGGICFVKADEVGVGIDEFYRVRFDADGDGLFRSEKDILIQFSGNQLIFERGDGSGFCATPDPCPVEVIFGTKGATDPAATGIPAEFVNTDSADVEFAINGWSDLVPNPHCFRVRVVAGSREDLADEDLSFDRDHNQSARSTATFTKEVRNETRNGQFGTTVSALPGEDVEFRVILTNTGNVPLDMLNITDMVPDGLTLDESSLSDDPGCVVNRMSGVKIVCDLVDVGVGVATTIRYTARVNDGEMGCLVNMATATVTSCAENDPEPDPVSAQVCVADIECEKLVSDKPGVFLGSTATLVPGQTAYFKVDITNPLSGNLDLTNVTMTDTLDAGFENIQVADPRCMVNGLIISCDIGTLAAGATTSVFYSATVSDSVLPPVTLRNRADVSGDLDGATATSMCPATVDVLAPCIECTAEISLDCGMTFLNAGAIRDLVPGQRVIFRSTITNCSDDVTLFNAKLQDDLVGFLNLMTADARCMVSGLSIMCDIGTLIPMQSEAVTYEAIVGDVALASHNLQVSGTPGCPPVNPGTDVATECAVPFRVLVTDIMCDKTASTGGPFVHDEIEVIPGQKVTFRVQATNTGMADFFKVTITDVLPVGVDLLMVPPGCNYDPPSRTLTCELGPLAATESASVTYMVQQITDEQKGTDPLPNVASIVGCPGTQKNPGTPVDTSQDPPCQVDIIPELPCLTCVQVAVLDPNDPNEVPANKIRAEMDDKVYFTATVTNCGDVPFNNVTFMDVLDPGFINPVVTTNGCSFTGLMLNCDIGSLPPGESRVIEYCATVNVDDGQVRSIGQFKGTPGPASNPGCDVETDPKDPECRVVVNVRNTCIECIYEASTDCVIFSTGPIDAVKGQEVFFRVTVRNCGDEPFFTTSLTDTLPIGYASLMASDPRCIVTDLTLTCADLGPLAPGEETIVEYKATVVADTPSPPPLMHMAKVTGTPGTPQLPEEVDMDICTLEVNVKPTQLKCVSEVSLDNIVFAPIVDVVKGQRVFFKTVITNCGMADFFKLNLHHVFPAGYIDIQTNTTGCSVTGQTVWCDLGPLGQGESIAVTYSAKLNLETAPPMTRATVTGTPGTKKNPGDEIPTDEECKYTIRILDPCLMCVKEVAVDGGFSPCETAFPGQDVEFRITITNCGNAPFYSISLNDVVRREYEMLEILEPLAGCEIQGNTISCSDLGPLGVGESVILRFKATVAECDPGPLPNIANVTGLTGSKENRGCDESDSCTAKVDVRLPCFNCEKSVSLDTPDEADRDFKQFLDVDTRDGPVDIIYRIKVTNCDATILRDVRVEDLFHEDLLNLATDDPRCNFDMAEPRMLICDLGDLNPAGMATIIVKATVPENYDDRIDNVATTYVTPGPVENPGFEKPSSCSAAINASAKIPTLGEWGLILFSVCLGGTMVIRNRRQQMRAA